MASDFGASGRYELQSICGINVDPRNEDVWTNTCPDSGKGAELSISLLKRTQAFGQDHDCIAPNCGKSLFPRGKAARIPGEHSALPEGYGGQAAHAVRRQPQGVQDSSGLADSENDLRVP